MNALRSNPPVIYLLSDFISEAGEFLVQAAMSQFEATAKEFQRKSHVKSIEQIEVIINQALQYNSVILYTFMRPDLKDFLEMHAKTLGLVHVDMMGPVINALARAFRLLPRNDPRLISEIDEAYSSKCKALDFAVKFDDGKDPCGLLQADMVVIGVSRVSKTPLCMYLAHKGIKVANVPLVREVSPPTELFQVPAQKVIGLTIKPSMLFEIRKERLRMMGLQHATSYTNMDDIMEELDYGQRIMHKIGCPIIDVSNKATEETAARVMEIYNKGVKKT